MSFIEALKGRVQPHPPIWLMRQAGRYLPEYRQLREENPSFLDLVLSPRKAAEITLQPIRRFGFDAAILFSDILVIPYAFGQSVSFGGGVHLGPLPSFEERQPGAFLEKLAPVFEAITHVKEKLGSLPLIGFAGGPFTVLCYMLGGTSQDGFRASRLWMYQHEEETSCLLDLLSEMTACYLERQVCAGVDALQLFESWASLVPWDRQEAWLIAPVRKIFKRLRKSHRTPLILYARKAHGLMKRYVNILRPEVLSLDEGGDLKKAPSGITLQGNLDPLALLEGGRSLEKAIENILESTKGRPFVFNLGHGILPETPIDHVETLLRLVRSS